MNKRRFREILFVSIIGLLLLWNVDHVQAGSLEQLTTNPDYDSILSISESLVSIANSCVPDFEQTITIDDIAFEDAVKDYLDHDIFSNNSMTVEQIDNIKNDVRYVWLIPIYIEDVTIWSTIADQKLMDMSNDEIERIEQADIQELQRNWTVTETWKSEESVPYKRKINEAVASTLEGSFHDYEIIVLGGTPQYRSLIALVNDGGTNTYIYPLQH